jgi:hypothetical protein
MGYRKFIFGETLEKALEAIPEEHQLRFYKIIKDYGLHGVEPDLSGFELAAWVQMKDMIDNSMPTQDKDISEKRSKAGKRGAEIRWRKDGDDDSAMANDSKDSKPDFAILPYSKNDKMVRGRGMVNGNVNENGNEKGEGD